jgi:hypothetical protein
MASNIFPRHSTRGREKMSNATLVMMCGGIGVAKRGALVFQFGGSHAWHVTHRRRTTWATYSTLTPAGHANLLFASTTSFLTPVCPMTLCCSTNTSVTLPSGTQILPPRIIHPW